MSAQKRLLKFAALFLGALALVLTASAQDPQTPPEQEPPSQSKPKPAARGIPSVADPNSTVENEAPPHSWQPDNGPATGMQTPSFGSPELGHSYWVPGAEYGNTIQSRALGTDGQNSWYTNNYIGGNLSLLEASSRSQFGLNYSGGGFFTTDSQQSNGWYSILGAGESLNLGRLQVQFFDYFSYLPESQFGFFGGTGLAIPGINGTLGASVPGLGVSVIPNQSIFNAVGPRYSNAFATQTTYLLSRRSSVTLGGSYGFLKFTEPGNVDNDMVVGTAGYNYQLTDTDTIGLFYRFTAFHYTGEPQAIGNHVVNVVYVKKISRRLALSVSGGPQITNYRVPVNDQTQSIQGSGGVSFSYSLDRAAVNASYYHGLTGGGGLYLGSNTDQATVTFGRQLGRVWTGHLNFGYARNSSLANAAGVARPSTSDWFIGGGVSRPIGREFNFAFSYTARFDSSGATGCIGSNCNSSYTQNLISITVQWHPRPFVLP